MVQIIEYTEGIHQALARAVDSDKDAVCTARHHCQCSGWAQSFRRKSKTRQDSSISAFRRNENRYDWEWIRSLGRRSSDSWVRVVKGGLSKVFCIPALGRQACLE